jgi:hypothetical protein
MLNSKRICNALKLLLKAKRNLALLLHKKDRKCGLFYWFLSPSLYQKGVGGDYRIPPNLPLKKGGAFR